MASKRDAGKPAVKYGDGSIRVRERKDGTRSYQARWFDGLQWRAKTFHGSIEQAEDFLRQRGRDARAGRYVANEDVTLVQAIDEYFKSPTRRWQPNTRATYGSVRDLIAKHPIGQTRLSDLTPRACQFWMNEMTERYSSTRLVMFRAVMRGALGDAVRLGVTHQNPMEGVRIAEADRREWEIWTQEQGRKALELSEGLLHTYYLVAMMTGMRPGEIRALLWSDVHLDRGIIRVSATMTRDINYSPIRGTTTKGKRSRTVVITDEVIDELRSHKARQNERRLRTEHWHDGNYVFDRGNGMYLPQQTISRQHREFAHKHGLPVCRLHDLRHFTATALFRAGADIKVISDTLGHRTVRTTQDVYTHVDENQQREVAELMRDALSLKRKSV